MIEEEIARLRASIARSYEAALRGSGEVERPIYPPYRRLVALLGHEQAEQIVREIIAEVERRVEQGHALAGERVWVITCAEARDYARRRCHD